MAPPALVIFDCDGVLVDSEPLSMRVLLETLAARGVELDVATAYDRFLGRSLATVQDSLAREFNVTLDAEALAGMRQRLYLTFEAELQPVKGVAETLDASSSLPERVELSLRVTGLWPHFRGKLFSAAMVARGKPAPDLFLHAASRMGHSPGATVVIEDSPVGLEAAKAAGMAAVGFVGGSHARTPAHRAALEALRPDAMLDDMAALPDLLAAF